SCWTTLPSRSGMEKARMTRHGRPVVREVAMRERLAELGGRIGGASRLSNRFGSAEDPIAKYRRQGAAREARPDDRRFDQ
ncbi:MAG: hypothetical protein ACTHNQ_01135, partial [Microbacterium sp.]|uniref:hypothetical protein n=1 Tax=Microbacterium sp. TaxID=51671 RepID=UPI003F7E068C